MRPGAKQIFLINVPVGAAVIMAALRYLPADSPRKARRLDLQGVATLSASLLLLVLPLILGRSERWPLDVDLPGRERAGLRAVAADISGVSTTALQIGAATSHQRDPVT